MRTFKARLFGLTGAVLIAMLVSQLLPAPTAYGKDANYASAAIAYRIGVGAYQKSSWQQAMHALKYASDNGIMLADFYRARMYADSETPYFERAKAYELYKNLVKQLIEIDADYDPRVRFAGQALTALARYVRDGIPEIDLRPDLRLAVDYLNYAASFFKDRDAEFELARMRLTGNGVDAIPRLAVHALSRLARQGHPGALATLAEVYWRGSKRYWKKGDLHVPRDPETAYALISLAAEDPPYSDRIWIEDLYQKIYCAVNENVRARAVASVEGWHVKHRRRRTEPASSPDLMRSLIPRPIRTCSNGEKVKFGWPKPKRLVTPPPAITPPGFHHANPAGDLPIGHKLR